jgi:hypothetical protein
VLLATIFDRRSARRDAGGEGDRGPIDDSDVVGQSA